MVDRDLPCARCNKRVPIKTLRYDKSGTYLSCQECRGVESTQETPEKLREAPAQSGGPFSGAKIHKYQCPQCRYTFRRTPTTPVTKCPNCGSEKLLKYEKVNADDVLKMSDDEQFKNL